MKRRALVALCAILILTVILVACGGEPTSLTLTKDEITLRPDATFDVQTLVRREGKGKVSYAVENLDVLSLQGSKITAKEEGEGVVIVTSGDFVVRLTVHVSRGNRLNVEWNDATVVYDGKAHFLNPVGYLPEGTTVEYTIGGVPFTGATEVGSYRVDIRITPAEGYVVEREARQATLTVVKGRYDLSGVGFGNKTFTYDGEEKAVFITGVLPEGVTVTYENNRAVDAGRYVAKARFSGAENYEEIADLTCNFVIEPQLVPLAEHGFGTLVKTYDGEGVRGELTGIPQGVTAAFYGDEHGAAYDENAYKNAGSYRAYMTLTATEKACKNYRFTTETEEVTFEKSGDRYVSALLRRSVTVEKAALSPQRFVAVKRDGSAAESVSYGQTLGAGPEANADVRFILTGTGPVGVKGEYADAFTVEYRLPETNFYGNVDSGAREVSATYTLPDSYLRNYLPVGTVRYAFTVNKAPVNFDTVAFSFDFTEKVFDGTTYEVRLENYDEVNYDATYSVYRDGYAALKVMHAGAYFLRGTLTRKTDAANYENAPVFTYELTILPFAVELGDVRFVDASYVYDGGSKTLTVTGDLPENVTVTYTPSASYVNAGVYPVAAKFAYVSEVALGGDYYFTLGGESTATLSATLTVTKARYDASVTAAITAAEGLTWRYGMTFGDVPLSDERAAWRFPAEEIGALTATGETEGETTGEAYYNADPSNYFDAFFTVTVRLNKSRIDLTDAEVPDQFVAKTGSVWATVYVTGAPQGVRTELTKTGETYTVTVLPVVPDNSYIVGDAVFTDVAVYPYDPAKYAYREGTTALRAYKGAATTVVVPAGTTVVENGAFTGTGAEEIAFPSTLTRVVSGALYGATGLRKLTMTSLDCLGESFSQIFGGGATPDPVELVLTEQTTLGDSALEGAKMLASVEFTRPPVSFGNSAFSECTALTNLTFDGSALASVGQNAFYKCYALKTLRLPSLVGEGSAATLSHYFGNSLPSCTLETLIFTSRNDYVLADDALKGAKSLKTVTFSSGLTALGAGAFDGCAAPVDLSGTRVTALPAYALEGFAGASLALPRVLSVGNYAFRNATCPSVELPDSVTGIGKCAFDGCTANVRFAEGSTITELGEECFSGWLGEEIILPAGVTTVGKKAFYHAVNLVSVSLPALTTLGESCFEGCASLTSFDVAATTTEIGAYALQGCSALASVRFFALSAPTTGTGALNTQGSVVTVYIKSGADEASFRAALNASGAEYHYVIGRF